MNAVRRSNRNSQILVRRRTGLRNRPSVRLVGIKVAECVSGVGVGETLLESGVRLPAFASSSRRVRIRLGDGAGEPLDLVASGCMPFRSSCSSFKSAVVRGAGSCLDGEGIGQPCAVDLV